MLQLLIGTVMVLMRLLSSRPEGSILRSQPFYNLGSELVMGEGQNTPIPGLDGLIPTAVSLTDWDKDGYVDILIPFYNGDIVSMTLTEDYLSIEKLPIEGGPLSEMRVADFNQDSFDDMLLVSGDMNILTLVSGGIDGIVEPFEYFTLEEDNVREAQVFSVLPQIVQGVYSGSVIAAGWDGNEAVLFLTDLGHGPEPTTPEVLDVVSQEEDVLDVFPHIPKEEISLPKISKPIETMGQPLPGGVLPRHVLTVNQSFAYTLPEEEKKEFYSFRWLQPPPKGMFFHYDSRSVRWVPNDGQLGAYKLAYHVERKLGENVTPMTTKEDSLLTYKVVPNLEGDDERLWIYVNDPPLFASEPLGTEFVAGDTFVYTPIILDKNPDVSLNFNLRFHQTEWCSTVMVLYFGKLILLILPCTMFGWLLAMALTARLKTFLCLRVRVLKFYLRHPKMPPLMISIDISRYLAPRLEHILNFSLINNPDGMIINDTGTITWTPSLHKSTLNSLLLR
jgi:hypothetical protein